MQKPSIDVSKLKNSSFWMKLYRSQDPSGIVNIEQWNKWINIVCSNQVLSKIPIKSLARIISRPWPDDNESETLADYRSFIAVSKLNTEIQKTIILSLATVAIGYTGNKPHNYLNSETIDNGTFLNIYGNIPVSSLLKNDSWKEWQKTLLTSKLINAKISEIAPYIGIITTDEVKNVKISSLVKLNLLDLKSKYTGASLDIITICISTLSQIIKINNKFDTATTVGSTDLASFVLENYDTLKGMFEK